MNTQKYVCHTLNTNRHKVYVYKFIEDHGGGDNWTYEILETAMLNAIEEQKLKRHYIETP